MKISSSCLKISHSFSKTFVLLIVDLDETSDIIRIRRDDQIEVKIPQGVQCDMWLDIMLSRRIFQWLVIVEFKM